MGGDEEELGEEEGSQTIREEKKFFHMIMHSLVCPNKYVEEYLVKENNL